MRSDEERAIYREHARLKRLAFPELMRESNVRNWTRNAKAVAQCKRNWRRANPSKVAAAKRRWKKRHPEYERNRSRRRRRDDDRMKNWGLAWIRRNPVKVFAQCRKRQARIAGAKLGDQKAVARIYARAAVLRKYFDVVVDHIIPLVKQGRHAVENLQIIYRRENALKGARLDYVPSVVFG